VCILAVVVECSHAAVARCSLVAVVVSLVVVVVCNLDAVLAVVVGRNMMVDGSHDGTHDDDSEPRDDDVPPHSRRDDVRDEVEEDDAVGHVVMYLQEGAVVVLRSHSWLVDMAVDASVEEAAHILLAREDIDLQKILYDVVQ
jgi:hypothetical protein